MKSSNSTTPNSSATVFTNEQLDAKLAERGILEAARAAGWKPFVYKKHNANGWSYSVFDLQTGQVVIGDKSRKPALRWKNGHHRLQDGPKYGWPFGKQGCPPYYALPGARGAIASANGGAFMAAGEVDVLTYHSAGLPNVLSWLDGEGSIPTAVAETLTSLGVTDLYYFVDRDEAGERSGQGLIAALARTPIRVHVYRLPEKLGDKGDINNLWQYVRFDPVSFKAELQAVMDDPDARIMPEVNGNSEAQQRMAHRSAGSATKMSGDRDLINWDVERTRWVKEAVMPNLDATAPVKRGRGAGGVRHCPNPQHRDEHPSFRISYDRDHHVGVPQCSCDIQHQPKPWDRVASWVGAPSFKEWFKEQQKQTMVTHRRQSPGSAAQTKISSPAASQPTAPSEEWGEEDTELDPIFGGLGLGSKPSVPTDPDIGDRLMAQWSGDVAYFYGRWHKYQEGVWLPCPGIKADVWNAMKEATSEGLHPTSARANSILDYLQAMLTIDNALIDRAEDMLNLRNGQLSLKTGVLNPHNRSNFFTTQLAFDFDEQARCPQWDRVLSEILVDHEGKTDPSLVKLLCEAFGLSLTTDTSFQKGFWLYGDGGSGKSTVMEVLHGLLGDGFLTVDFNTLQRNNAYQLADLPGKRVVACSEAEVGGRLAENVMKAIISSDELSVARKYGHPFTVRPVAKLWWSMNHLPRTKDVSNAIFRRLIIIPFNRVIPEDKIDTALLPKLKTELPGVLNWALQGLRRLRANGKFTYAQLADRALEGYRETNDIEAAFLNDEKYCILDPALLEMSTPLYDVYRAYCLRNGHAPKSQKGVAAEWQRLGLVSCKSHGGHASYRGVGLTDYAETVADAVDKKLIQGR